MKTVFMGTPEFAVPALERLAESRHEIVLVITQPDRPKGRGQKLEPPPVKVAAERHGLRVIQPASVRRENVAEAIRATGADAVVVAAFGQLLPREVLQATRLGCLNIHPSMLPQYRGAAPIQRAILEGASDTGVTIMQLDEEMDHGPIIAQQPIEILEDDDALSVGNMLAALGADMLVRVLDEADRTGQIESVAQAHEEATFAPQIRKEEGLIDWTRPTQQIMYHLRGMTPWPGAFAYINGEQQLIVVQAEPLWENEAEELGEEAEQAKPGTVTSLMKGFGFTVRTGDGHLLVTRVKPEGKKPMDGWAYIIGRNINIGDRLGARKETSKA